MKCVNLGNKTLTRRLSGVGGKERMAPPSRTVQSRRHAQRVGLDTDEGADKVMMRQSLCFLSTARIHHNYVHIF